MSFLERTVSGFLARHGDAMTDVVHGWTASAPHLNPALNAIRHEHNAWLRGAELHRTYWGAGANYEWSWPIDNDHPHLVCDQMWTFVRRTNDKLHLVDRRGVTSFQAMVDAGGKGLTTREPSIPPKPRAMGPGFNGNLSDESTWSRRG